MTNQIASYGWTLWVIIGGMAVVTYLNRAGLLLLAGRFDLPPALRRALRFAPAAALAAIVAPDLLLHGGTLDVGPGNIRLVAGIAGFAVALATRSTLAAIVAGMLVLHAMERLL